MANSYGRFTAGVRTAAGLGDLQCFDHKSLMRLLSLPDAADMLLKGGPVAVDHRGHRLALTTARDTRIRLDVPSDYSRVISLAYVVAMSDVPSDDELDFTGASIWIVDWNIWGEASDRVGCVLLDAVRLSAETARPIAEAPVILLGADELGRAHSLLTLSLIFQWDAYYVPGSNKFAVFASHDGYLEILPPDSLVERRLFDRFTRGGWSPELVNS